MLILSLFLSDSAPHPSLPHQNTKEKCHLVEQISVVRRATARCQFRVNKDRFLFLHHIERRSDQLENPFSRLAPDQTIAIVPEFTFESSATIHQVPVAYKTWGELNSDGDNCMLICHPLTRSVDVEDW